MQQTELQSMSWTCRFRQTLYMRCQISLRCQRVPSGSTGKTGKERLSLRLGDERWGLNMCGSHFCGNLGHCYPAASRCPWLGRKLRGLGTSKLGRTEPVLSSDTQPPIQLFLQTSSRSWNCRYQGQSRHHHWTPPVPWPSNLG